MAYTPYYSGGWQSGQEGNTPITPAALNNMESGIENANDVINNLTSTSTTKPLAAAQGKVLKDKVNYGSESIASYITRADGSTDNIGRIVHTANHITLHMQLGGVALSAGENTVATLSKGYPSWASSSIGYPVACGFIGAGTNIGTPVRCTIDSSGVLKVYASAAITSTLRVTFSYGTADSALP